MGTDVSKGVAEASMGVDNSCKRNENDVYDDYEEEYEVQDTLKQNREAMQKVENPPEKKKHPGIKRGNPNRVFDDESDSDIVANIDGDPSPSERRNKRSEEQENQGIRPTQNENVEEEESEVFEVESPKEDNNDQEDEVYCYDQDNNDEDDLVIGIDAKPPSIDQNEEEELKEEEREGEDEDDEDPVAMIDFGSSFDISSGTNSLPPFEPQKKKEESEEEESDDEPIIPYLGDDDEQKSKKYDDDDEEEDVRTSEPSSPFQLKIQTDNNQEEGDDDEDDEPVKPADQEYLDDLERESRMIEKAEREAEELISEFKRQ